MKFELIINSQNAAFCDDAIYELTEILKQVAKDLDNLTLLDYNYDGRLTKKLRDTNGNAVGIVSLYNPNIED